MTNIAKTRVFETYPRISANTLQRLKNDITILKEFIHLRILCNSVKEKKTN
jgi:hypothetical protein